MLLDNIKAYEIRLWEWNPNNPEERGSNIDYDYVAATDGDWDLDDLLAHSGFTTESCGDYEKGLIVEVHEARSGHIHFHKNGDYDVEDCDTATGMNGCPIVLEYFTGLGEQVDYDEHLASLS